MHLEAGYMARNYLVFFAFWGDIVLNNLASGHNYRKALNLWFMCVDNFESISSIKGLQIVNWE